MALAGNVTAPSATQSFVDAALAELFRTAVGHEGAGQLDAAERVLGLILDAAPEQADALHLAGVVACRRKNWAQALDLMQRSLAHGLDTPLYVRNIAEVYRLVGRLDEALAAGRTAVTLNPVDPVVLSNLAIIHASRGEDAETERCARAALRLDPAHAGAHFALAELLLARGDLQAGWEEYEWRFQMRGGPRNLPPHGKPQWDGRPLPPRRLLVVADQGFGDAIQFGRFLPWALQRCPDPLVACSTQMRLILRQLGAKWTSSRWDAIPEYDAYIPLSGLPRLAGATLETLPSATSYLAADPARASTWKDRLDAMTPAGMRRIGLVWAGRPEHGQDHTRSMCLTDLAPLFSLARTVLVCLQKGKRMSEVGQYAGKAPLVNLGPSLVDWDDTMAVLENLDAVVTVDTAVAHLAGALGRKVMLLLPKVAEWRWMRERTDTPWYPTVKLYRQAMPGVWSHALSSLTNDIDLEGVAP